MKHNLKRALATLLAFCMVLTMLPLTGLAASDIGNGWMQVNAGDAEAEASTYTISARGQQLISQCGTAPGGFTTIHYYYVADDAEAVEFQNNSSTVTINFRTSLRFYLTRLLSTVDGNSYTTDNIGGSSLAAFATVSKSKFRLPSTDIVYSVYTDAQSEADAQWYLSGSEIEFVTRICYKSYTPDTKPVAQWIPVDVDGTATPDDATDNAVAQEAGYSFTLPTVADWYDYVIDTADTSTFATVPGGEEIAFTTSMMFRASILGAYYYAVFSDGYGKVTDIVKADKTTLPDFPAGTTVNDWTFDAAAINTVEAGGIITFTAPPATAVYTVKFMSNGALVDMQEYDEGTVPVAPVVSMAGYTFTGWSNGTTTYNAYALPGVTADVTYTATLVASTYSIRVESTATYNGADYNTGSYSTMTATYGQYYTFPEYNGQVPSGTKFIGWSGVNGAFYLPDPVATKYAITENENLVPVFAADTEYWIVNFVGEGGSYGASLVEQSPTASVHLPTYAPYSLATWTEQTSGSEYVPGDDVAITADTVFIANVPALCEVVFLSESGNLLNIENLRAGLIPMAPQVPEVTGKTFIGWHCDDDAPEVSYLSEDIPAIAESRVYRATYSTNNYTVTGDAYCTISGGDPTDNVFTYGKQATVTLTAPEGSTLNYITATGAVSGDAIAVVRVGENTFRFAMPAEDVNVVGIFTENIYRIIFKDGSSIVGIQDVPYNTVPADPVLTKDGYVFSGWTDGVDVYQHGNLPVATAAETYTALWDAVEYDINIDEPDVVHTNSDTASVGDIVNVTVNEVYGYDTLYVLVFAFNAATGEYDIAVPVMHTEYDPTGNAQWQFTMPAANVLVVDGFASHIFDVQFKDGDVLLSHQSVAFEAAPIEPNPVKAGYTLTGWTDGTDVYDIGTLPGAAADVTYTALWDAIDYDINVDEPDIVYPDRTTANVGDIVNVTIDEEYGYDTSYILVFAYNEETGEYSIAVPVMHTEYDPSGFNNWQFTMPAADVLVLDGYTEHIFDVKFKDGDVMLDHQSIAYEEYAVEPAPTKEGNTLIGWVDQYDNFYDANNLPDIEDDLVFTAVWEANLYDLIYYRGEEGDASEHKCFLQLPDGTIVEFFNNDTINMPTYALPDLPYGSQVELGEAILPGFVFQYWKDESGHRWDAGEIYTLPEGGQLLTAVWTVDPELSCLVRFMNNGALYDAYLAYDGETRQIPAVDPVQDGSIFLGWTYDGQTYANDGVNEFDVEVSENREMVLEAVWANETYGMSFIGEGTENMFPIVGIPYGAEITLPEAPEREGYTFVAWRDSVNGACYNASALYTVKYTVQMEALWSKDDITYIVKFYNENGNLYDYELVADGETITAPDYGDGRPDCEYVWVSGNLHYFAGEDITPTDNLDFTAVKLDEAQYNVSAKVFPNDAPTNTATIDNDKYFAGDIVNVEIQIPEGYILKNVTAYGQGTDMIPVADGLLTYINGIALYYFQMPVADVEVIVELEKIPAGKTAVKFMVDGQLFDYEIVTKGENGIAPTDIPAKDGYTFLYWKDGNSIVDTGDAFAVAADAEDLIIYNAVFEKLDYLVSYDANGGVPQPATQTLHYGDLITLAAAPSKADSEFIGWVEDATGFIYSEGSTYTVKGDVTFTAKWVVEGVVVKFVDPITGIIYGYEQIDKGTSLVAPQAPIADGRTFVEWVNAANTADVVRAGGLTRQLFEDTVYLATYTVSTHGITLYSEHCTINLNAAGTVSVGTAVQFTVTPIENYKTDSVILTYTDDLSPVVRELKPAADGTYTFVMPDADVTITAKAVQNIFSIFTNADEKTHIDTQNKAEVGETVYFSADTNDSDYLLRNVYVQTENGQMIPVTKIDNNGTFVFAFVMPAEDVTIYADSVPAEFSVTYLDSDNTVLGIYPVYSGEYANAPAPVKEGYTFDHWQILPLSNPEVRFDPATNAVTDDLIVRAVYVGDAHTVEAGLIDNLEVLRAECTVSSGNINSSDLFQSALIAETGKDVLFIVAAEYDYTITGIAVTGLNGSKTVIEPTLRLKDTVDGIDYYTVSFKMPAEDVKIDVYTVAKLFPVYVEENVAFAGEYTLNGFYTNNLLCAQGSTVTIDVAPIAGYEVAEVYGEFIDKNSVLSRVDGVASADNTQYTFPMVGYDVTVYIVYAPIDYTVEMQTSNFASYRPDTAVNPAAVVESLDEALTSKGKITIEGVADIDYTNALSQVYKIPDNGIANVGDRVRFTVEEYTGYDVDTVSVTYNDGEKTCPLTVKDGVYIFDMPADDVVITVTFIEETYNVIKDAASEDYGTVAINGLKENNVAADYKDEVTVVVTPFDGYQITDIYYVLADGTVMDFDNAAYTAADDMTDVLDSAHSITFHMPASDVTVYAEYAPIEYSVSDVCGDATVTYTTPHTVGEQVSFETEADYGFIITAVYVINDTTGEYVEAHGISTNSIYGDKYTFTMPASSVTIHVETIEDQFNVIYLANGTMIDYEDVDYLDEADVASRVDMVNTAPEGCHFVGWTSKQVQTPVTVPSVDNADFVIVENRTYITAAYEKDEIDVLFEKTVNGTVTEDSTGNTAEYLLDTTVFGDTVNFTVTPDAGYVVDKVQVATTDASGYNLDVRYSVNGDKYSFVIPASYKASIHDIQAEDVVVTVTFKKDTFTSDLTVIGEGKVTLDGYDTDNNTAEYLDTVTIGVTPAEGWMLSTIVVDGGAVAINEVIDPAGGNYTFTMPDHDVQIVVTLIKINYSVATPDINGKVTATPDTNVTIGDQVQVALEPAEGYHLDYVYATGDMSGNNIALTKVDEQNYYFLMPAENVTVTAVFAKNVYTVTFFDWNGDMLKVDYVEYLNAATAPADPARVGYTFIGWDTIFNSVTSDLTVTALYKIITSELTSYSISFTGDSHGTISIPSGATADFGSVITVVCDPDDGFRFESISVLAADGHYVNTSFVSEDANHVVTYSFVMPDCDVQITVSCEEYASSYYDDVRTDFWFNEAVEFVSDRGYFCGITETLFGPYINMTRGMFVTVLSRVYGIDASKYTGTAFADVKETAYYASAIKWASESGIVYGYSSASFGPNDPVTREQMAAIMFRYCEFIGCDMTPINAAFMARYTDKDEISKWALSSVEWAVGVGLMRGRSSTTINPRELASRAEVAQIIKNLCDKILFQ